MFFSSSKYFVGKDEFGNSYYIKNGKRFVSYNGKAEATKVSPVWYLWLHYATDDVPTDGSVCSQLRVPNITGTDFVYKPFSTTNVDALYKRWIP